MKYPSPYIAPGLPVRTKAELIEAILLSVAGEYGIDVELLMRDGRTQRAISTPKQEAYYIMKTLAKASVLDISKRFGLHHSTVIHGINLVMFDESINPFVADRIQRIKEAVILSKYEQ